MTGEHKIQPVHYILTETSLMSKDDILMSKDDINHIYKFIYFFQNTAYYSISRSKKKDGLQQLRKP